MTARYSTLKNPVFEAKEAISKAELQSHHGEYTQRPRAF